MLEDFSGDYAPYEDADTWLLSEQPPTLPPEKIENDFDWLVVFEHLESTLSSMRSWRYSWWTYWSKLAEFILPRRYHWLVTANLMRRGNPLNQAIIDGTAGLAKNICYTGMVDGLCPTTRPWFTRGVAIDDFNLDAESAAYLEECDRRAEVVLAESNFYEAIAQVAEDEVVFGTAPLVVYEDAEDVVHFDTPCAGEYYLAVSGKNKVDTIYTEQAKTVKALVDFFRLENCPSCVRELWAQGGGSLNNEFVLARAIEPNFDLQGKSGGKPISVVKGGYPFREVFWLRGQKTEKPLSVRGFHDKPFASFRWATTSNDPYGRGPGMDALGDVMQLQIETRRKAEAIEKQVRPPMGADPAMKNEPASINPGHITYVAADGQKKGFWSLYDVKIDLNAMIADMKDIRDRLDRYFYVDVFMAISRMEGVQPRQNMEIAARKAEAMQRLGPIIGLWKTEMHAVLERVYAIAERKKLFPPKPRGLQNVPLKFNFLDMVTIAQLAAETTTMEDGLKFGGELSLAAKNANLPDPLRIVNLDEAFRLYLQRRHFPIRGLFTQKEVKKHDAIRQQVMQSKQAAEQIPAATQPLVSAATSLANIPPDGGNSMLGQLLGGAKGGSAPPSAGPSS